MSAADGTSLNVWRAGTPGARPIVFAHGLSDDGRCWWRVADAIERGSGEVDLVLPDARNHGRSGTGANHADRLASDLIDVIDQLELGGCSAIGHSMGARSLAHAAVVQPSRFTSLVLVDPPWTRQNEFAERTDDVERHDAIHQWLVSLSSSTFDELAAMGRALHPDWPDDEYDTWIASNQLVRPEAAAIGGSPPWGDIVSVLSSPTLLVRGDAEIDGIVTDDVARAVIACNHLVTTAKIDGAGHNIHRERTAEFLEAISGIVQHSSEPSQHAPPCGGENS